MRRNKIFENLKITITFCKFQILDNDNFSNLQKRKKALVTIQNRNFIWYDFFLFR